jgi:hypothetical protein
LRGLQPGALAAPTPPRRLEACSIVARGLPPGKVAPGRWLAGGAVGVKSGSHAARGPHCCTLLSSGGAELRVSCREAGE